VGQDHGGVATVVRTGSVLCVPGSPLLARLLDMGQRRRANPGKDHRQQHKAVQEAQDAHDGEHGEVVEPECVVPASQKILILILFQNQLKCQLRCMC
jgi:hypothetical protein